MENLTSGGMTADEWALVTGTVGGIFGGMFIMVAILCLVLYILQIVAGWKIFKKAGEKGWKSLIPIYNTYIFYKIVKMEKWFIAILIVSLVFSFITNLMGVNTSDPQFYTTGANLAMTLVSILVGIFGIVVSVIYSIRTAKAFGHGIGFAIGLIFLQPIFLLILGLGSSKYDKKYVKSLK